MGLGSSCSETPTVSWQQISQGSTVLSSPLQWPAAFRSNCRPPGRTLQSNVQTQSCPAGNQTRCTHVQASGTRPSSSLVSWLQAENFSAHIIHVFSLSSIFVFHLQHWRCLCCFCMLFFPFLLVIRALALGGSEIYILYTHTYKQAHTYVFILTEDKSLVTGLEPRGYYFPAYKVSRFFC